MQQLSQRKSVQAFTRCYAAAPLHTNPLRPFGLTTAHERLYSYHLYDHSFLYKYAPPSRST